MMRLAARCVVFGVRSMPVARALSYSGEVSGSPSSRRISAWDTRGTPMPCTVRISPASIRRLTVASETPRAFAASEMLSGLFSVCPFAIFRAIRSASASNWSSANLTSRKLLTCGWWVGVSWPLASLRPNIQVELKVSGAGAWLPFSRRQASRYRAK